MTKEKTESNSIENIFEQLERIISRLESGEIPLEKSLALFEEGMALSENCRTQLNNAERRVKELIKESSEKT